MYDEEVHAFMYGWLPQYMHEKRKNELFKLQGLLGILPTQFK